MTYNCEEVKEGIHHSLKEEIVSQLDGPLGRQEKGVKDSIKTEVSDDSFSVLYPLTIFSVKRVWKGKVTGYCRYGFSTDRFTDSSGEWLFVGSSLI